MTRHSAFHQLQNLHMDEIFSRGGIRYTGSQHFDVIFAVLFEFIDFSVLYGQRLMHNPLMNIQGL